VQPWRR